MNEEYWNVSQYGQKVYLKKEQDRVEGDWKNLSKGEIANKNLDSGLI